MRKILLAISTLLLAVACSDRQPGHTNLAPANDRVETAAEDSHGSDTGHAIRWDYGAEAGPSQWGSLNPDFALCDAGMEQSPIDLTVALASDEEVEVRRNFQPAQLHISYQESTVNLLDNGHTIQISFDDGNTIDVGDKEFAMVQYHFHAPSEHTLNGEHFPIEVHFVHATKTGELSVVGAFIEQGEHNAAFDPVWDNLPREPGESRVLEGHDVDLDALVPKGGAAFRYEGSLTTPPCNGSLPSRVRTGATNGRRFWSLSISWS